MSSTNVMEKNNRKVEITNDSGKLTVKAVVEQSDQPENNYDVYEDIDMRFHRQQKSEQEFTILLRRRLEQRLALGRRIAKARVRRGMSQKILATKLGVTPRYIAQAEIGDTRVTKANIELIANVLEVSIGYLYGFTQIMDGDIILYDGGDLQKAIAIAKMYLSSSLDPYDFKAQIETVLEAVAHLELNEPIEEILAS